MRVVAWDSWAFIEAATQAPRLSDIEELLGHVDLVVTTRDVLVETFNFLVKATRQTALAWSWLLGAADGRIRIVDPPLGDLLAFVASRPRDGRLSLTDYSLALAARQAGATEVATEDNEFRRLGLTPLFSRGGPA